MLLQPHKHNSSTSYTGDPIGSDFATHTHNTSHGPTTGPILVVQSGGTLSHTHNASIWHIAPVVYAYSTDGAGSEDDDELGQDDDLCWWYDYKCKEQTISDAKAGAEPDKLQVLSEIRLNAQIDEAVLMGQIRQAQLQSELLEIQLRNQEMGQRILTGISIGTMILILAKP